MPFPEYSTREQWIEIASSAATWASNATALERFQVPMVQVIAIIGAEAAGADDGGRSVLSPEQVAEASGASVRTVRLIRAGLANSGLMSHTSPVSPVMQLQIPRGTAEGAGHSHDL